MKLTALLGGLLLVLIITACATSSQPVAQAGPETVAPTATALETPEPSSTLTREPISTSTPTAKPTNTAKPTATATQTATLAPTSSATATPTPRSFVGVSEVDPEILQACIDQGYICMPLPCNPEGVKEAEFLPYYKGPDPKDGNKEIEVGLFGIDLEPGTIVVAPFDGEMSWWRGSRCDKELFEKRGWDESELVDCDYYRFFLSVKLPSGQVIDLDFYPGEIEVLAPESTRASGAVFPLHPVSAGTPIFRYIGGLGHEANPKITQSKFLYNQDGPGFIKRKIRCGLMVGGWFGFPEERDKGVIYQQQIKVAANEEGKLVYILARE